MININTMNLHAGIDEERKESVLAPDALYKQVTSNPKLDIQ